MTSGARVESATGHATFCWKVFEKTMLRAPWIILLLECQAKWWFEIESKLDIWWAPKEHNTLCGKQMRERHESTRQILNTPPEIRPILGRVYPLTDEHSNEGSQWGHWSTALDKPDIFEVSPWYSIDYLNEMVGLIRIQVEIGFKSTLVIVPSNPDVRPPPNHTHHDSIYQWT